MYGSYHVSNKYFSLVKVGFRSGRTVERFQWIQTQSTEHTIIDQAIFW